jgi:hypothetical protein
MIQTPAATLSMEVSYPYHSHLIGRSGQNVNRVMDESGTRIHFPDRNRIVGEYKCNNVIIRGPMANIEQARTRIRVSHQALSAILIFIGVVLKDKSRVSLDGYSGRDYCRLQQ